MQRSREDSQRVAVHFAGVRGQLAATPTQIAVAADRARSAEMRLDRSLADSRVFAGGEGQRRLR